MHRNVIMLRSIGGTMVFAVIGILSWVYFINDWRLSLPLGIFYVTLLFNTYFSIRLFSSVTPPDNRVQTVLDVLLFVSYVLIALNVWSVPRFIFFSLLMFIIATLKYAFLLNAVPHPKLLKRKIAVDLLGTFVLALALGGALAGFLLTSAWLMAAVFLAANIILFSVHPLYRLDNE